MGQSRSNDALAIDIHVGLRLRQMRQERGLSLLALARLMGHSSGQAVSKYEQGAAFPAALMFVTARALSVPLNAFFEGVEDAKVGTAEAGGPPAPSALSDTTEARKIVHLLRQTPPTQHGVVLQVVKTLCQAMPDRAAEGPG